MAAIEAKKINIENARRAQRAAVAINQVAEAPITQPPAAEEPQPDGKHDQFGHE